MLACLRYLLGYLWALPLTAAGLVVARLGGAHSSRMGPDGSILLVGDRGLVLTFFEVGGFAAFCWGGVIVARAPRMLEPGRLLRHELEHFAQARRWGVLLPLAYVVAGFVAMAQGGRWYWHNAFEVAARAAEAEDRSR